jgi:hypothetical protein
MPSISSTLRRSKSWRSTTDNSPFRLEQERLEYQLVEQVVLALHGESRLATYTTTRACVSLPLADPLH